MNSLEVDVALMVKRAREIWKEEQTGNPRLADYMECVRKSMREHNYSPIRIEVLEKVKAGFLEESELAVKQFLKLHERSSRIPLSRGERLDRQGHILRPENGYQRD